MIEVTNKNAENLLRRISDRYEVFSPKHRTLAKYVLENYLGLAYVTISEFARKAGVSETTIVRFACLLGYTGFADFMAALREEIEKSKAASYALSEYVLERGKYEFPRDAMRAIFTLEISVMEETLAKTPADLFERAVDAIYSASNLVIIGCGANRCLSQAAYFAFGVLRPNVNIVEHFGLTAKNLFESIPKNAACLVFSTPRYDKETQLILECFEQRGKHKPFVVGVTDSLLSPIAPHADLVLQVPEKFVLFMDTNAAYMALIHALAFALHLKNPDYSRKRIEAYDAFVKEHNFFVRDYLDLIDF
ncbi:MAG: MurR/RpiR family transcriptional regulator [Synergistaceae bacterium]|nr:MurR/RpiR family transcriptional regulator [Synergistaceae bacterium]